MWGSVLERSHGQSVAHTPVQPLTSYRGALLGRHRMHLPYGHVHAIKTLPHGWLPGLHEKQALGLGLAFLGIGS